MEGQFYLLYPLLYKTVPLKHLQYVLVVMSLLSLCSAQHCVKTNPDAAFYLAHNRAWELLLGAHLALLAYRPVAPWKADVAVFLSLCLLLGAARTYSADTAFPGFAALVPCIAAGLVIAAGEASRVAQWALGKEWLGLVGRVSYSLYLVHWPVLVWIGEEAERLERVFGVVVMGSSAIGLYWGVERVWRVTGEVKIDKEVWLRGVGLVGGFVVWAGVLASGGRLVWGHAGNWSGERGENLMRVVASRVLEVGMRQSRVFTGGTEKLERMTAFEVGGEARVAEALVVGDSHAGRMLTFANYIGLKYSVRFHVVSYPGCLPLFGVRKVRKSVGVGQGSLTEKDFEACDSMSEEWRRGIVRGNFSHVFLVSRWSTSLEEGEYYKRGPLAEYRLLERGQERGSDIPGVNASRVVFERALRRTVKEAAAAGKKVVVVSEVPDIGRGSFLCKQWLKKRQRGDGGALRRGAKDRQPGVCVGASRGLVMKRLAYTNRVIEEVTRAVKGVECITPSRYFCDNHGQDRRHCRVLWEDKMLYTDSDHLSDFGSLYLALRWETDREAYFPKGWKFG